MVEPRGAVIQFIEEHPELEETVEEIIALDEEGPWTFQDVSCDSGAFGEIVSREFVEPTGDRYQLVDREATRAALRDGLDNSDKDTDGAEKEGATDNPSSATRTSGGSKSDSTVEFRQITSVITRSISTYRVTLLLVLTLLFIMRSITFRTVFRDKFIVFPGNDPYHYRHHVDRLLDASPGLLDFSGITTVLGGRTTGEPFTYVLGWWLTTLIEGAPDTSGFVLAWLPVVAALVVGVSIAWMAVVVTEDERIAVLAVFALALTPAHALYSGIGFFDHHSLDYMWLTLMAAALVALADTVERRGGSEHLRTPRTWFATVGFGFACAIAMLSWNGAPLLLLGVVLYGVVLPASVVRTGHSPLLTSIPLAAGLAVATGVTHFVHTTAGWQEPAVVYAPALVLLGVVGVALSSEGISRKDGESWWVLLSAVGVGTVALVSLWLIAPNIFERLLNRFTGALLGRDSAVETQSLFAPKLSLTFNPIRYFGLLLLFVVPGLLLASKRCIEEHEPRWLVLTSYGWALFALTIIQIRFAGEFSPFSSIFAGVGFVWGLSRVGFCRPLACSGDREHRKLEFRSSVRNVNSALYVSFVLVVITAVGVIFTVGMLSSVVITDQQYNAAAWISEDDDDGEYVLSHWGRNRLYNYFSWGGGDGYGFARSNYAPFLASENPDEWYGRLTDRQSHRVDYLVFDEQRIGQAFPYPEWLNAVGHFQLAYVSEFDRISVFRTVEGAMVAGEAPPGSTVDVTTDIEVNGYEYTYTREAAVDQNGEFTVRVAYPGTYTVGNRTVDVSTTDVNDGESVPVLDDE